MRSITCTSATLDRTLICWDAEGEISGCSVEFDGEYKEFVRSDGTKHVFPIKCLFDGDTEGCASAPEFSDWHGPLTRCPLWHDSNTICEAIR